MSLDTEGVWAKVTTSGVVGTSGKDVVFLGIILINGGAACSAVLTANSSSSGPEQMSCTDGSTTVKNMTQVMPNFNSYIAGGIYCTLAGAGAYCYVGYRQVRG